jgi:hypothetical protein
VGVCLAPLKKKAACGLPFLFPFILPNPPLVGIGCQPS